MAPAGFKVELYAHEGITEPRQIRMAPNGDFFVADSMPGEIKIFRGRSADGKPEQVSTFATGLKQPFGIAFYPVGAIRSGFTSATRIRWSVFPITRAT
jgi:glucose/arabinose dehydrogenase